MALNQETSPTRSEIFTFVQITDVQFGYGESYEYDLDSFRYAVKQINHLNPDFVVMCGGDLGITATDHSAFTDFNEIRRGLNMPSYCALGNHDLIQDTPSRSNLESYRQIMGEDHLSFEHKGYTFIIVNTQLWKNPIKGEDEADLHDKWFIQTLKTAYEKQHHVFVVGHYPLFLKTADEEENAFTLPPARRTMLINLFEQYGVVAMLTGHTHAFIANNYNGVQLVSCETTSQNLDGRLLGFRMWHVGEARAPEHEFIAIARCGDDGRDTMKGGSK